eukprot:768244-Hanusia_phi.AAC.1
MSESVPRLCIISAADAISGGSVEVWLVTGGPGRGPRPAGPTGPESPGLRVGVPSGRATVRRSAVRLCGIGEISKVQRLRRPGGPEPAAGLSGLMRRRFFESRVIISDATAYRTAPAGRAAGGTRAVTVPGTAGTPGFPVGVCQTGVPYPVTESLSRRFNLPRLAARRRRDRSLGGPRASLLPGGGGRAPAAEPPTVTAWRPGRWHGAGQCHRVVAVGRSDQ